MVNFIWQNGGSITAGVTLRQSWEEYNIDTGVYLPFNYNRITNDSLSGIIFYPNQDTAQGIVIPAGSNVSIDGDIVRSLWSFAIKNSDASNTITVNQITILSARTKQVQ